MVHVKNWACWYTFASPAFRILRQKDHQFNISLNYTLRLYLKIINLKIYSHELCWSSIKFHFLLIHSILYFFFYYQKHSLGMCIKYSHFELPSQQDDGIFVTYFSDNLGYFLFVYLMFVSGFFREREIIEARRYGDANDGDR